MKITLADPANR